MSLVLYRKYRPRNLGEIIAQEAIVKTLAAALEKDSLGHALLLTGPRGVGKTSLARILAHRLNNIEYKLDETPLDIIEIDAASSGRIEEVRDLREKIKLMPISLKYKVYIIDEVHMLTTESFNALLKTLEEPPAHIVFILATTEIHKVPATIISRCQRFTFKTIPVDQLLTHLAEIAKREKIKAEKEALGLLAEHAQGSLRDALSLLDQLASLGQTIDSALVESILGLPPQSMIQQILTTLEKGKIKDLAIAYRELSSRGVDPIILAGRLSQALRDELRNHPENPRNLEKINLLEDLLDVFSARQPQATLEIVLLKHTQTNEAAKK